MKTSMKKQARRPVVTSSSPASVSNTDMATKRKASAVASDIEKPSLTPEQVEFHLLLTADNGFSMEAALERLAQKKTAKSTP